MTRLEQLRERQKEFDCLPISTMRMYAEMDICGCCVCPHEKECNRLINSILSEEKLKAAAESLDQIILDLEEV